MASEGILKLLISTIFLLGINWPVLAGMSQWPTVEKLNQKLKNSPTDTGKVTLLLRLSEHYVNQPGEEPSDLDSALMLAQEAKQISERLHFQAGLGKSYIKFSEISREKEERGNGMVYVNKAIDILSKVNIQLELGNAYFEKKNYFSAFSTPELLTERIRYTELAQQAYQDAKATLKRAIALHELGDLQQLAGNQPQAISSLKQSLQLYQEANYPLLQGVYDLLGFVYGQISDFEGALKYGLLAMQYAEHSQDSSMMLCTIYNRIGLTYYQMHQLEKADQFYRKSLYIAKKYKDANAIIQLTCNIVNGLLNLNRANEALSFLQKISETYTPTDNNHWVRLNSSFLLIYKALGQYELAQKYCNKLLAMSANMEQSAPDQLYVYQAIIPFFITTQQYQQAGEYLLANEAWCKENRHLLGLSNNHLWWFRLDSAQAQYPAAIAHYQQYEALRNSMFNEAKSNKIEELQIQYETTEKERKIELNEKNIALLTKDRDLKEVKLEQTSFIRNVTLIGVILLLIIVSLLLNQYRVKQRSNRKISQKNLVLEQLLKDKEWLLKEVHHRVKNNLQVLMSLLQSQCRYIENDVAKHAIRESQNRMRAISLIHQKLYQSDNLAYIDTRVYIEDLVAYLKKCFETQKSIQLKTTIVPILLDVSQAVPLGLILNETITNAIKYAFTEKEKGIIEIKLDYVDTQLLRLCVKDDGVGLPDNFDLFSQRSLGLNLIHGLTEQLEGTLKIKNNPGLSISIIFPFKNPSEIIPENSPASEVLRLI